MLQRLPGSLGSPGRLGEALAVVLVLPPSQSAAPAVALAGDPPGVAAGATMWPKAAQVGRAHHPRDGAQRPSGHSGRLWTRAGQRLSPCVRPIAPLHWRPLPCAQRQTAGTGPQAQPGAWAWQCARPGSHWLARGPMPAAPTRPQTA